MEYLHIDAWTTDLNQLKTFLIREPGDANPREVAVVKDLKKDEWTSLIFHFLNGQVGYNSRRFIPI